MGEPFGELPLQWMKKQVRRVQQRLRLFADDTRQARVGVTERGHTDSREQVQVLTALRVPEAHALATYERDRLTAVRLQNVPCFECLNVFHHSRHVSILASGRLERRPLPNVG